MKLIYAAIAVAALIGSAPSAYADDPQPPPLPPGQLSPGAADQINKAYQDYQTWPCGMSMGPHGLRLKNCPPGTPPPAP